MLESSSECLTHANLNFTTISSIFSENKLMLEGIKSSKKNIYVGLHAILRHYMDQVQRVSKKISGQNDHPCIIFYSIKTNLKKI